MSKIIKGTTPTILLTLFVIECVTSADDVQPDTDLSALANGAIVRRLAAGGTFKQTLKTPAYITI